MVVQWLRLRAPNAGGQGSIPSQGTRAHMPQLRPGAAKYIYIYIYIYFFFFFFKYGNLIISNSSLCSLSSGGGSSSSL